MIEIEKIDGITILSINNPKKRNCVNKLIADELFNAVIEFENDKNQKILILTGKGGNFCAGADLSSFSSRNRNELRKEGRIGPMGPTRLKLSKPTIAAINGYAVAGGLELACWCDLRVASQNAKFGVLCRNMDVPLIDGGTVRLPRLIGQSRAMDLILTGRLIDAQEAFEIGLINRLSGSNDCLRDALVLAQSLLRLPSSAMMNDKQSLLNQWGMNEEDAMIDEFQFGMVAMVTGKAFSLAEEFSKRKSKL